MSLAMLVASLLSGLRAGVAGLSMWPRVGLAVAFFEFVSAGSTLLIQPHILLNLTGSMDVGLYARRPLPAGLVAGDIITFCPFRDMIVRGKQIGVEFFPGNCPQRTDVFIKRVIAVPGDTVDTRGPLLRVNGRIIAGSESIDERRARIVRSVPRGVYVVRHGHVWVLSDSRDGYDSRYYGPIVPLMLASPLLTFHTNER